MDERDLPPPGEPDRDEPATPDDASADGPERDRAAQVPQQPPDWGWW